MGRILDLFGEVAAAVEEGVDGVVLPPEEWDRLQEDWPEEDIQDAIEMVKDNLLQAELVSAADSLSARLVEMLGAFGKEDAFKQLEAGTATISALNVGHLARRVDRLEEILAVYRDTDPPDRAAFDELRARLMDLGLDEMIAVGRLRDMGFGGSRTEPESDPDERGRRVDRSSNDADEEDD